MGFLPQFAAALNAQIPAFRVLLQGDWRPASVAESTKVGCGVFPSPAEHHAGCAVRTPFSSACSNGRSNYLLRSRVRLFMHRAYFSRTRGAMLVCTENLIR